MCCKATDCRSCPNAAASWPMLVCARSSRQAAHASKVTMPSSPAHTLIIQAAPGGDLLLCVGGKTCHRELLLTFRQQETADNGAAACHPGCMHVM